MNKKQLRQEGFICTDPDTNQWVKKISDTVFHVFENEETHEINISEHTEKEILGYISPYGYTLESVKEIYGEDANQIIAECIAETDSIY